MAAKFWVSTGDIREKYEPLNVVSTFVGVPAPAFGSINFTKGFDAALNQLAQAAMKIEGANGVIWISYSPQWFGAIGFVVFAQGTAVRVTPEKP